uniref:Reverse transcriptase Ty1/copia-type domain-containing protein n=1 Tax=Tanacetum cinerariifolium TaxID=118510 RepID=A0A6L2JS97_TANCI|nr:hypothetical protein [Tanacetum cinerariifolium]
MMFDPLDNKYDSLLVLVEPLLCSTYDIPSICIKSLVDSWRIVIAIGLQSAWNQRESVLDEQVIADCNNDQGLEKNLTKGHLQTVISEEDFVLQIRNLKTRKEMWEAIKTHNLGVDRVKEARLQTLITEFENLKMSDNDSIDAYAAKFSSIASKSATHEEVMSEHKLVKKFLTSLPRRFFHIVASLEQVLDLKMTGFEDVVGRLKAYKERVKEEDKANDPQENLLYARTEYSNGNNDSNGGRGCDSFSQGRGRGQGQGRGRGNSQNQVQRDSSKNHEDNEQKVNLNETQEKGVYHEEGTFFMMNHIQETIFMNKEKYTPPKSESNTDEDDVWYFDNGASKNGEQKSLKDVYYILALRSNVISLRQATIFGYDISIRGNFLTMRDSWGSLLIKVLRIANRLYKAQLKVGKEGTNKLGRESDEEVNPHSSSVTVHETNPEGEEDDSGSDNTPNPLVRLETIRLLIAFAAEKGWKIHHLEVKRDFINGDRTKLGSTLKDLGFLQCVQDKLVYRKVPNREFIIVVVYVDDFFMIGTCLDGIIEFKRRMTSQFKMSNLGTLPITWCSRKQTTVALSSCEAEFMAAIAAACQEIWLRELLAEGFYATCMDQFIIRSVELRLQSRDVTLRVLIRMMTGISDCGQRFEVLSVVLIVDFLD